MKEMTEVEIKEHQNYHGDLDSLQVHSAKGEKGALVLELRAGGDRYVSSRHLVLTNAPQLLGEMNRIRGTLDPSPEDRILAEMRAIRKLLEGKDCA